MMQIFFFSKLNIFFFDIENTVITVCNYRLKKAESANCQKFFYCILNASFDEFPTVNDLKCKIRKKNLFFFSRFKTNSYPIIFS